MKKLTYLFVAFCLTTVASAQKLTEKDIQGTWKLVSLEAAGMKIDVPTEKVTFSPEMQAQMSPELQQQAQAEIGGAMEMFKESFAYIEGKSMRQAMGPEEAKGTFEIAQKDGKSVMTYTMDDGVVEEIAVSMVDKKLTLSMNDEGTSTVLIYTKQ